MTARTPISMAELYETDFVLWTEKTAEQLKERHFDAVDWENVIHLDLGDVNHHFSSQ